MAEKTGNNEEKKRSKRGLRVQRVRGMQDFLPAQAASMARIARIAEDVARLYGFERIETPILEQAQLFRRSLGLASDVVMKEMYAFTDKNGDELCLRPEGTAGAVRALIDGGLTQTLPQRWFYEGPMFRRERPQRGRFRQFHQCGVELLGIGDLEINDMGANIEVIACAWRFLQELRLEDKVTLKINWLPMAGQRDAYRIKIQNHFQEYADKNALSEESIKRLQLGNPFRILDSKDAQDQKAIENVPRVTLDENNAFSETLNNLNIPHVNDFRLVRGLDYYNEFVFEFVEKDATREQATVLAGGRYDGLCEQLGGKPVRAIGWAAGLERLADMSIGKRDKIIIYITEEKPNTVAQTKVAEMLRTKIYNSFISKSKKQIFTPKSFSRLHGMYDMLSWQKKVAAKSNADYMIHIGCKPSEIIFFKIGEKQHKKFSNEDELIAHLKIVLEDIEES